MTSVPSVSPTLPVPAEAPAPLTALPAAGSRHLVVKALALLFLLLLFAPPFWFGGNEYRMNQYARFAALALFALSVDLIWGYAGLLSLGQGLYFGLGAYAMGYCLILQEAARAEGLPPVFAPDMARPDYMVQCRLPQVPWLIGQFIDLKVALTVAILLPTLLAAGFGYIVFRRRIKGVYFSLVTQALVFATFVLVSNQRPYTGGVDGLTNLADLTLFGYQFKTSYSLYFLVTGILVFCFLGVALLLQSKFGRVLTAIRDNEFRVLALGYNTAMYKTFAFALAGMMAGLAGALFTAVNNSAGPQFFNIESSIEVVIFVAVGGRGTLVGAVLGAFLVNIGRDWINAHWRDWWPIILGFLFILIVLFLPDGILGGLRRLGKFVGQLRFTRRPAA